MRIIRSSIFVAALLALPLVAAAERAETVAGDQKQDTLTVEKIVEKHIVALGGEKVLRSGKTFTFTVSGEKMGKKFTKVVTQARPNKIRVDVTHDDGPMSKGYDGKVAWIKKGTEAAVAMNAEETASMAAHAQFDEPLLDYAKKGTTLKLVGKADVKGADAYDVEVAFKSGDVEHHFIDAKSFLLIKRTMPSKDKDGKAITASVRFGDYKKVQGRMINHSVEWDADDGKSYKSAVSAIAFDKKVDAKIFAMPK